MRWTDKESYSLPVVLAVGLHVIILVGGSVGLVLGDDEPPAPKRPPIVNATIVDVSDTIIGKREAELRQAAAQAQQEAQKKAKEAARKKAEHEALEKQRRQAQAAQKKREAAERKAEADRRALLEREKAEKARKAEAAKKKAQQEQAKKEKAQQEAEQKRRLEEKKRAEEEKRKRQEQERAKELERQRQLEAKAIAEAEEARRRQAEAEVQKAIAEEEAKQLRIEEGQAVQSISSLIMDRIASVWIRPPNARNGMKTKLRIGFLPSGEVSTVDVLESSGDSLFDQRAKDAVVKMGRVEELADVDYAIFERNFRQIELLFNPQDLRN